METPKTQLTFFETTATTAKTTIKTTVKKHYKKQLKKIQMVFDFGQKAKKNQKKIKLNYSEEKAQLIRFYERFDYGVRFLTSYDKKACETYEDLNLKRITKPVNQSVAVFNARQRERMLRMKKMNNSKDMFKYADEITFAATEDCEDDFESVDTMMRLIMSSFIIDFNIDLKKEWQVYERLDDVFKIFVNENTIIEKMEKLGYKIEKLEARNITKAKNILMNFFNRKFKELDALSDIIYPTRKKIRKIGINDTLTLAA